MKRFLTIFAAVFAFALYSCEGGPTDPDDDPDNTDNPGRPGTPGAFTVVPTTLKVETYKANPTGLSIGLWTRDGQFNTQCFADFGRLPFERVGFYTWKKFETSPGVYDFSTPVKKMTTIQQFGGTPVIALNNISGPWFGKDKDSQIPSSYMPAISEKAMELYDITEDATIMAAGKAYIKGMITGILQQVGKVIVAFDYEMMWNCTPDTPLRRKIIRNWFIEAAASAREAAAALGMQDKLMIMPIVNGAVNSDGFGDKMFGSPVDGHTPAAWMLDIMDVCDALGIDNYHIDKFNLTSEEANIKTLEFWTKNYAKKKNGTLLPVYMAETGFSTGKTENPAYNETSDKAVGTEDQQKIYFTNLISKVIQENVLGGRLNGQLRWLNLWMYRDVNMDGDDVAARFRHNYYGFVRMDWTKKPGFYVIKDFIARIENDPYTAPSLLASSATLEGDERSNASTTFNDGLNLDCVVAEFAVEPNSKYKLSVEFKKMGYIVLQIDDAWYQTTTEGLGATFSFSTGATAAATTVKLYPTGSKVPFTQTIKNVYLTKQ